MGLETEFEDVIRLGGSCVYENAYDKGKVQRAKMVCPVDA